MIQILSNIEKERISHAGRVILSETGIKIHYKPVYEKLSDAGALPVKGSDDALLFPKEMVDKYMALCPKRFSIKDRRGYVSEIFSGSGSLYYTSNAVSYVRGTSRKAVDIGKNELTEFIRVADSLEHVHGVVGTSIKEYPPHARDYAGFRLMAEYTYKHLRPCIYTPDGVDAILEMADVILEGSPLAENMFFTLGYSIVSPLSWTETALKLFEKSKGYKIPIMINSEPMAGGTSPVTLAGSLALSDAEVISGIVINQVLEPGRPCVYNAGFAHVLDMLTAIVLTGSPENALLQSAGAEMAAYYDLPCASWALSDAPMLDAQASYEKILTLFAHTLSHVSMIWGIGNIETSKTISPEAAVIDNELIGNCQRFLQGIKVDEEHLAMDVIKETGFSGRFLETEHTYKHYRDEIRNSLLPNRINRLQWEAKGSKSLEEKAEDSVNNILKSKGERYLSGTQAEKLDNIVKKRMELT